MDKFVVRTFSHRPLIIALTKSAAEDYIYSKIHAVMEFTGEHIRSEPPSWPITPFKSYAMSESKNLGNKSFPSSLSAEYAFIVLFGVVSLSSDMTHEGARRAGNTEPGRDAMRPHATSETGMARDSVCMKPGSNWRHDRSSYHYVVLAAGGTMRHAFSFLLIPALAALTILLVTRIRYPHPQLSKCPKENLKGAHFPKASGSICRGIMVAAGFVDYPLLGSFSENGPHEAISL